MADNMSTPDYTQWEVNPADLPPGIPKRTVYVRGTEDVVARTETEEQARQISAVPDMLAAITMTHAELNTLRSYLTQPHRRHVEACIEAMDAALKKAKA
jgi:hypothetical protein